MKTQDIKNMGHAYLSVLEAMKKKKLDPVDKDELKGDHEDRDDKDIDNDGDTDKSDVFLHKKRQAISKASKGKEVETSEATSNASKVFNKIAAKAGGGEKGKKMAAGLLHKMKKEEVETTESVVEAKKMKISAKQIKTALASAKAQAKPKDQVSLKKAPWDEKKESVKAESKTWTIFNRIMEKATHAGNSDKEKADQGASGKDKEFIKMMGGLDGQDSGIDGAKAAQQTIDSIRASGKVAPKRPGDQDVGDKKIVK
jgi:hypothetical protein